MKKSFKRVVAFLLVIFMITSDLATQRVFAQDVQSEFGTETVTETETATETEAVAETETAAETEAVAETETAAETEAVAETETVAETEAVAETETAAETEAVVEAETAEETEAVAESETAPLLNYVYVDENNVEMPGTQNIVMSFGDENTVIDSAKLHIQNADGEEHILEAAKLDGNAVLFTESYLESSAEGVYTLYSYDITVNGTTYTQVLSEAGVDVSYGVNQTAESQPDAYVVDENDTDDDVDYNIVSFDENGNQTSEDSIEEAIESNSDGAEKKLKSSGGNIVVVLDPGHGGSDGGASGNGLQEKNLTLKIAQYAKQKLEEYYGVSVYMTRTSDTYISLEDRVNYAKSVNADLMVSIHINSSTSGSAHGAEVFYPNGNYNGNASATGSAVASNILNQLVSLGLNNRGTKIRYSKDYKYPDDSTADYYSIIRNSKLQGIPGIIVEHAFISNAEDASNYLSSDASLQKLGIADATGIANYYNLSTVPPFKIDSITATEQSNYLNVKASCSNGSDIQYRYLYYDVAAGAWGVISEWTTESSVKWQPKAGEYWIQVSAIDGKGTAVTKTIGYTANKDYTGYYITLNGMCYIMNDNSIDVGVAYETNASGVNFKWQAYNLDNKSWSLVADWTGANWVTWKPEQGNYWLYVEAMTADGTTESTIMCFAAQKDYSHHSLNLNGMCYNMYDDRIDVGIAYDSDDSNVAFKWEAYNLDKKEWYTVADWTGANWVSWKPQKGNYWLHVTAMTSDAVTKEYTICFNVARNYNTNYISLNGICSTNSNAAINLGVAYTTNDASPAFKWQIYDLSTSSWTTIADWNGGNWVSWYPNSGNYWVYVEAKTSDGDVESYCIAYQVTARYAIMGGSNTSVSQMVAYYNANNAYPLFYSSSDAPSIEAFCQIYQEECKAEGVNAEVAFCQAMLETGFLRYGGDVKIEQYNFAGLGATGGGNPGNSFSSVREGIRAQVQHLKAYASTADLNNACVDSRFKYVSRGTAPYVEWLGINENPYGKGWATGKNYGYNIVNLYIAKLFKY